MRMVADHAKNVDGRKIKNEKQIKKEFDEFFNSIMDKQGNLYIEDLDRWARRESHEKVNMKNFFGTTSTKYNKLFKVFLHNFTTISVYKYKEDSDRNPLDTKQPKWKFHFPDKTDVVSYKETGEFSSPIQFTTYVRNSDSGGDSLSNADSFDSTSSMPPSEEALPVPPRPPPPLTKAEQHKALAVRAKRKKAEAEEEEAAAAALAPAAAPTQASSSAAAVAAVDDTRTPPTGTGVDQQTPQIQNVTGKFVYSIVYLVCVPF